MKEFNRRKFLIASITAGAIAATLPNFSRNYRTASNRQPKCHKSGTVRKRKIFNFIITISKKL